MATPTRSQAVSTPKSHLSNTPGKHMASPRPGTSSAAHKSLAYKSPAVKTPSSVHGSHAHHPSVSSQPSSTPLGPAAAHDTLINLDSPAVALLNSIVPTGMTPLTPAQDGLGITTNPQTLPSRDGEFARSPEAERLHRLQQVVSMLQTKMVGRGINRESIERVSRVRGFEALWDEDNLTVAGNIVELEIVFDPLVKDKVTDLTLNFNSADGESQFQEAATNLLKSEIGIQDPSAPELAPDDLQELSDNLHYLAQMDRISITPNAFEVVGSLYKTLRDIWEEEKKRMKSRRDVQHLCRSATGRPQMDGKPRLGLSVDYWRNRPEDQGTQTDPDSDAGSSITHELMQYHISCQEGNQSILSTLEWLSPYVLNEEQPENVLDSGDSLLQQPAWLQPDGAQLDGDPSTARPVAETPKFLNAGFVCEFSPDVLVPLNTALRLNTDGRTIEIDQSKAITYAQALQNVRNTYLTRSENRDMKPRWSRQVPTVVTGPKTHSYALYAAPHGAELWFYPLSKVQFGHPRQLADVLPTARQYAVVWALFRNLVVDPVPSSESMPPNQTPDKRRIVKRSNMKSTKLSAMGSTTETSPFPDREALKIDISLDTISDPTACKLEVFAPMPNASASRIRTPFVHYTVAIKPNGVIEVSELSSTSESDANHMKSKMGRMLSLTEDVGLVTAWLMERMGKSTNQS